jgi:hypothetical protein
MCIIHAQEAVRFHQDGRESYQVLARGVFTEKALFRAKIALKSLDILVGSFYVARTLQ